MRHRAYGRHVRYHCRRPARALLIAALAVLAASLAVLGGAGAFTASAQSRVQLAAMADRGAGQAAPASLSRAVVFPAASQARLIAARHAAAAAALTYTVRPGDTLSGVAMRKCGAARYWTGIYAASRARGWTARDADVLLAGQRLYLSCAYRPSMLRYATTPVLPGSATRAYVTTAVQSSRSQRSTPPGPARPGYYSYAGLEVLWDSAGGPAWAAPHAAEIAECESGGRVSAYNASGASGLWQILGEVVPGNIFDPYVNALNAVAKFRASGDTFAQWVCT